MIKLIDNSISFLGNYTYCDHFPGQARNIILLMNHYSEDSYAEQILERVLSEIIKLELDSISEEQIVPTLGNFITEINWRLYSLFSQRPDLERGISLFLGIMESNKMYLVQFGRYFMGVIDQNEFQITGRDWENLSVKSLPDIRLLGSQDTDISVKVEQIDFPENSYFIALESTAALKLKELGLHYLSITEHLCQLKESNRFSFVLIKNWRQSAHNTNRWIRRKRVNKTATILLILIIISAAYVYYGKNLIDDLFNRIKITRTEFTRNDIKQQFFLLQEQAQDLLKELSREDMNIEIFPKQVLKMEVDWEIGITASLTNIPCFDYRRIFVSSEQYIYAIDKRDSGIKWERRFDAKVEVLRLVDANRILVSLSDNRLFCLSRDNGEVIWQKNYELHEGQNFRNSLCQISLNQFRQLDDSIFVTYHGNKLTLAQIRTGEIITEYENAEPIDNISDYDMLEKCIYITVGKKLIKINIKVIT